MVFALSKKVLASGPRFEKRATSCSASLWFFEYFLNSGSKVKIERMKLPRKVWVGGFFLEFMSIQN